MTIGTILNHRYRIEALIGSGGMALVYRAINLTNRRPVAVKVLRQEYRDNAEFLMRFEREARAVLHLSHDNIVRAYGVGQYDGIPYIVMEYVEGKTLKQIIQENGPMPARTAIRITCQVLEALSAAHATGIIHRDVKPQNVIVTRDGRAKLTDFGIARDVDASTVTFAGDTVIGSVHYLSPEQATGTPVTAASDIYSTGVMLYEMLTGTVPFTGETSVSIALKHINDVPVEPIQQNPKIQPMLNSIVLRAMCKNPADRYPTAKAMRNDLLHAQHAPAGALRGRPVSLSGSPASGGEQNPADQAAKWHGSFKIALVVGLCICALLGTFFGMRSLRTQPATAQLPVPILAEKTVAEATQRASEYGFALVIAEYETSNTVPHGCIISQEPAAGTSARAGTEIYVVVSAGPEAPTVPNLVGQTYEDALTLLAEAGLDIGKVSYRVSDVAIGYICEQTPLAGTEVSAGQLVDVCISATSAQQVQMPVVTGLPLTEALSLLDQNGFSDILLRYDVDSAKEPGMVDAQSPEALATVQAGMAVSLVVAGSPADRPYSADIAYNLTIGANGTDVMATIVEAEAGVRFERVVYEVTLEKSDIIPVSFTAYAASEGLHELILYIDGQEVRRQEASFGLRSQ